MYISAADKWKELFPNARSRIWSLKQVEPFNTKSSRMLICLPTRLKSSSHYDKLSDQGSISSTFYLQLLRSRSADMTVFFAHLGSTWVKAVRKYVGENYSPGFSSLV